MPLLIWMETYVMKIHVELAGSAEQVPNDKLGSEVRFAEAGWNIILWVCHVDSVVFNPRRRLPVFLYW